MKQWIFRLLGKGTRKPWWSPFAAASPNCAAAWRKRCARWFPDRRHFVATAENWAELQRELKPYRIGLAPVMLTREANALRRAAYRLAPHKILAYNSRLERHHLRFDLPSLLFWRGVPLDRIYLRPWWWPWKKRERSVVPSGYRVVEGRACTEGRRRVAVLSPYFPFPWRMAARCASTIFCARWRSSSISSCSPSPMVPWNWRRCWSFARAWCWWKSRAIASRAGARCCRPRSTSSARPP